MTDDLFKGLLAYNEALVKNRVRAAKISIAHQCRKANEAITYRLGGLYWQREQNRLMRAMLEHMEMINNPRIVINEDGSRIWLVA